MHYRSDIVLRSVPRDASGLIVCRASATQAPPCRNASSTCCLPVMHRAGPSQPQRFNHSIPPPSTFPLAGFPCPLVCCACITSLLISGHRALLNVGNPSCPRPGRRCSPRGRHGPLSGRFALLLSPLFTPQHQEMQQLLLPLQRRLCRLADSPQSPRSLNFMRYAQSRCVHDCIPFTCPHEPSHYCFIT